MDIRLVGGEVVDYLIVDGYNIIGASPDLSLLATTELEEARYKLQEDLSEYGAYRGLYLVLVFDGHQTKEAMANVIKVNQNMEVVFTPKGETADQHIEKLVSAVKKFNNKVYVATSDAVEQRLTFAKGALRQSARELLIELESLESDIKDRSDQLLEGQFSKNRIRHKLDPKVLMHLEALRKQKNN